MFFGSCPRSSRQRLQVGPSVLRTVLAATLLSVAALPAIAQAPLTATVNDFANNGNGFGNLNGLMQASDGNFYMPGQGTATNIIRVVPNSGDTAGAIGDLAGQLASTCGITIVSNLVEASDGNLYGITDSGAANGNGSLFKYVISTRTCTPVYSFNPSVDGSYPSQLGGGSGGGLIYGNDGNFYGTFGYNGGSANNGSVFQITPAGVYSTVYSFCSTGVSGCPDGKRPAGYLIQASDGNFYGVTDNGGSGASQGVFYQIVPGVTFPWVENSLYNISCSGGCDPLGPIVEGPDGYLYGAMSGYGGHGQGAFFQSDFLGDFDDFYDLTSQYNEPQNLFVGGDGNMYGTVDPYSCDCDGEIYELTPTTGNFTPLGNFEASTLYETNSGAAGQIIQGSDGNFYGTMPYGGTKSLGGIFQAVPSVAIPAPVQVTLSETTSAGTPVTVSWEVLNATSDTYRNCYLYTNPAQGGGTFTGKATGTQSGSTLSGSTVVTPTSTGTYTYAVTCGGTESGISPLLTVTGLAAAATKTVLTETPSTINIGATGSATATVTRTSVTGTPSGSVNFEVDGEVLQNVKLNGSGVATFSANTTGVAPGVYPLEAVYVPDSTDAASTSNVIDVTLKYATTTTLTITPGTITVPGNATITVHVTSTSGTPSGTFNLVVDGSDTVLSNVTLTNGSATVVAPTTGFPNGMYTVQAVYSGSTTQNTSTSNTVSVTLN
jgi:uncharacterized repeat protein (TIGR03803 family)